MCLPSIKYLRVRVCIIHILFEWESFEEMATGRAEIYLIRLRGQTSPMIAGASTQNPVTHCLEMVHYCILSPYTNNAPNFQISTAF